MEQTLTLVCKLQPTPEQILKIEELLHAFAEGCNYANEAVTARITSKTTIQTQVYRDLRVKFGLSANQAVRVCARVAANRLAAKRKSKLVQLFRPTSADYDARIFAYRENEQSVSLTLLGCREHIKLKLGNYQNGKLVGKTPKSAQLCKHRDGHYYVHIHVDEEVPEPAPTTEVIGVDLGRRKLAVTSQGETFEGQLVQNVRDRFSRVRSSLQRKGTKGSKRCLKRLSGRERRYQTWVNHRISKQIVQESKTAKATIALEDLRGIRQRTNNQPRNKTERRRSNSWAFYQLRQFITYKAVQAGVSVVLVPPAYSSQTHHACLHMGKRSGERFWCETCQVYEDADENASQVLRLMGLSVNQPENSWLSCLLKTA